MAEVKNNTKKEKPHFRNKAIIWLSIAALGLLSACSPSKPTMAATPFATTTQETIVGDDVCGGDQPGSLLTCPWEQVGNKQVVLGWHADNVRVDSDLVTNGMQVVSGDCLDAANNAVALEQLEQPVMGLGLQDWAIFEVNEADGTVCIVDSLGQTRAMPVAEFGRLLGQVAKNGSEGVMPIMPVEPEIPYQPPVEPQAEIPLVVPPSEPRNINLDQYVLPALGLVCGVPFVIWGISASIGVLRSQGAGEVSGYEESSARNNEQNSDNAGVQESHRVQGLSARQVERLNVTRSQIQEQNPFGFCSSTERVNAFHEGGCDFANEEILNKFFTAQAESYEEIVGVPMREARVSTSVKAAKELGGSENLRRAIMAGIAKRMRE